MLLVVEVEEVGEEAEDAHVSCVHLPDSLIFGWNLLDDVAGHQEEQKDPSEDKESDENGEETTGGNSNSLSITSEGGTFGPEDVRDITPKGNANESDEEGNGEGPDITVGSVLRLNGNKLKNSKYF